ncbi:MAG: HD domain-containing protein [Candidatus Aminicenantes bacterium]|nr:MAG: HD domain-containing protein [Candidatus Aminicenantes bacterium]
MVEKIKIALLNLSSAIQAGKIYSKDHPSFQEFIVRAFNALHEVLSRKKELVIGIVEDELAWEGDIFFSLSQKLNALVLYLQEKNIERVVFLPDMNQEELSSFALYLIDREKRGAADAHEYLMALGVRNIRAGKIRALTTQQAVEEDIATTKKKRKNKTVRNVSQIIENMLSEEDVDYLELKFNVLNYMEDYLGSRQELVDLVSIKKKDLNTFLHMLNVSIICMYVTSKLGYSQEDVLDLGIAGLFHDIGKLAVSRRILTKPTKLEEDEFYKMKHHTTQGAEILVKYMDAVGKLPAVVAYEHHLRHDMTGYPRQTHPHKPHTASMIVSMCDVYDALAQRRSYKKDFPPKKIYNIMMEGKGTAFDQELLESFFRVLGVWPIGTIVSLSNRRIAIVRKTNEKDIFNPVVEVVHPQKWRGVIDLSEEGTKLKITKSLNPFKEGKKYLQQIESQA